MQKLIKLSDTHYIVVDDSEIKEGDWCIATYLNPNEYYLVQATDIRLGNVEHGKQLLFIYNNFTHEVRFCKKITHSTQPLEDKYIAHSETIMGDIVKSYHRIKPLSLSEIEEVINEYTVEKMIPTKFCIPHKHYISEDDKICYDTGFKDGFKAHQELVKDKLFDIEDMQKALWCLGDVLFNNNQNGIAEGEPEKYFSVIIQSLLPKTEWNIKFDEQGKIKLK